jgi:hypothetical protein
VNDYEKIRRTNRSLASLTKLPLLVCCDLVKLKAGGRLASIGDGYIGGFLGRFRGMPDGQLKDLARLNAFMLSALGVNVLLGPTVDTSTAEQRIEERARIVISELDAFGIQPVLKHYPFLPAGANLHRESPDTRIPLADAEKRAAIFRLLASEAGIMMTTHVSDTLVDPRIVTFSSQWNQLLRKDTGFKGLLMTDGLLMLTHYANRVALLPPPTPTPPPTVSLTAAWAAAAILAGHDMVIVEGSVAQTVAVFDGLLRMAREDTKEARGLRARIEESYAKIVSWKGQEESILRRTVDVPASVAGKVIGILPGDAAVPGAFRFDAKALAAIEPALLAAEVGQ